MYSAQVCVAVMAAAGSAGLFAAGKTMPDFEVASIRLHTDMMSPSSTTVLPGGRLSAVNLSVRKMIRNAFDVEDYQISGAPRWIDTTSYDIAAKMPAGVELTRDDIPELLKNLLRSRFQLRYRRETEKLTEYAIETGKGGAKLTPHQGDDESHSNTSSRAGIVSLSARGVPIDDLAYSLRRQLGRPVTDKTGLNGTFDIDLTWAAEEAPDSTLPSLFTALQKLGLRLVSMKGPVEVIEVEGIEKASEN
ncbi:MAG TPA: TIGR03435 family protein [Bryobacteraceae bacterium]|nr:TIGR03435 family protein [Bryobacteraceae bacterium]